LATRRELISESIFYVVAETRWRELLAVPTRCV
jgi:hypothetical protein